MISRSLLDQLDRADELAPFRREFALPDGVVYLDGNSLGPLPRATAARVAQVVEQEWGCGLIRSWDEASQGGAGWMSLPMRVGEAIGRIIGAAPGCTAVADSTSVNAYKLLAAALALRPGRRVILTERTNFPTDLYIAEGLCAHVGCELRAVAADELAQAAGDDVAVMMLTHVNYRTGRMHDMAALTRAAHEAGALALWDLAHSAGAVPLDVAGDEIDLAIGCGYKFLNGGPGAPAFAYIAPSLHESFRSPLTGWLGHADPFAFEPSYRPAAGAARAIVGTPQILSLAALEVGVEMFSRAPMRLLREKSVRMAELFADLVEQECPGEFTLASPREASLRGSQACLSHPDAAAVMRRLIARGVIGDFRPPDVLRFGITPLFLRYADLWDAVAALRGSV